MPPRLRERLSSRCENYGAATVTKRLRKMAKRRKAAADEQPARTVNDKIAGALAFLAVKGLEKDDAALKLDAIGFTSHEISALLDVNESYVRVAKYRSKKKPKRRGE
jgi:3-deoxy-D-arabino-heptulosonate 7-phosphate (DAHP) synthase class II